MNVTKRSFKQLDGYNAHKMMEIARYIKGPISYADMASYLHCDERLFKSLCETGTANAPIGRHILQNMSELAADEYSKEDVFGAAGMTNFMGEDQQDVNSHSYPHHSRKALIIHATPNDNDFLRMLKKPIDGMTITQGANYYGISNYTLRSLVCGTNHGCVCGTTLNTLAKKLDLNAGQLKKMLHASKAVSGEVLVSNDNRPVDKMSDVTIKEINGLAADVKMQPGQVVITLTGKVTIDAIVKACKAAGAETMNLKL